MSKQKLESIHEQVHATVGRTLQLVRYIEEHFGSESLVTKKAKFALESLLDLDNEISSIDHDRV